MSRFINKICKVGYGNIPDYVNVTKLAFLKIINLHSVLNYTQTDIDCNFVIQVKEQMYSFKLNILLYLFIINIFHLFFK